VLKAMNGKASRLIGSGRGEVEDLEMVKSKVGKKFGRDVKQGTLASPLEPTSHQVKQASLAI